MPPRTHSSSSHSSHSFSSSRSSSSSSRSYSSSSRSYSRGPSGHSSSSHSSAPRTGYGSGRVSPSRPYGPGDNGSRVYRRPRVRQPVIMPQRMTPIIFYGRSHDYVYYNEPWEYDNVTYEPGYYDENGNRYDNLLMQDANGKNTIILKCDYCGNVLKTDWTEGTIPTCPGCGAPMKLENIQKDTIFSSERYDASAPSRGSYDAKKTSKGTGCLIAFLIVLALLIIFGAFVRETAYQPDFNDIYEAPEMTGNSGDTTVSGSYSNVDLYGETLYLKRSGDDSYVVTTEQEADKSLEWMDLFESYYDDETETYLWYNTAVSPALWQYWVEGVSSAYDSGWMEYEDGTWYIQKGEDDPYTVYDGDTSEFWHIGKD